MIASRLLVNEIDPAGGSRLRLRDNLLSRDYQAPHHRRQDSIVSLTCSTSKKAGDSAVSHKFLGEKVHDDVLEHDAKWTMLKNSEVEIPSTKGSVVQARGVQQLLFILHTVQ